VAEGVSTGGGTPRDDERAWLRLHKEHSVASPVAVTVADSQVLSYMNETFTFWHSRGHTAKWMHMRLGTDVLDTAKAKGWVLASELVLRNQELKPGSLHAFLADIHLEEHAHALRGMGVTDVDALAVQGDQIFIEAGLSPPARRILGRALAARVRELEVAEDVRRRDVAAAQMQNAAISGIFQPQAERQPRPQTASADFRQHSSPQRAASAGPRFSSAASDGVGTECLEGQRPSARSRRRRGRGGGGGGGGGGRSSSPTKRPSTAPLRNPVRDISLHGSSSSPPQHQKGFVGSASSGGGSSLGVMSGIAARAVVDGSWPQDNRRFSGGGFALSSGGGGSDDREPKQQQQPPLMPSASEPLLNHRQEQQPQPSGPPPSALSSGAQRPSLSQVVLSSASSPIVEYVASSAVRESGPTAAAASVAATTRRQEQQQQQQQQQQQSKPWLDSVATGNSLRRSNKARSGVKTQSAFGRVGARPAGEGTLQPDAVRKTP
jgi:hypothetical protein